MIRLFVADVSCNGVTATSPKLHACELRVLLDLENQAILEGTAPQRHGPSLAKDTVEILHGEIELGRGGPEKFSKDIVERRPPVLAAETLDHAPCPMTT